VTGWPLDTFRGLSDVELATVIDVLHERAGGDG